MLRLTTVARLVFWGLNNELYLASSMSWDAEGQF